MSRAAHSGVIVGWAPTSTDKGASEGAIANDSHPCPRQQLDEPTGSQRLHQDEHAQHLCERSATTQRVQSSSKIQTPLRNVFYLGMPCVLVKLME